MLYLNWSKTCPQITINVNVVLLHYADENLGDIGNERRSSLWLRFHRGPCHWRNTEETNAVIVYVTRHSIGGLTCLGPPKLTRLLSLWLRKWIYLARCVLDIKRILFQNLVFSTRLHLVNFKLKWQDNKMRQTKLPVRFV